MARRPLIAALVAVLAISSGSIAHAGKKAARKAGAGHHRAFSLHGPISRLNSVHDLLPQVRGLKGDGKLTILRPDKNERQTFVYHDARGRYDRKAFEEIEHFFRCRMTGETHPIDPELIEILDAIEDYFGGREMRLVSMYRSPARNALMRRQGRGVACDSLHMYGRAADIEVAGIAPALIRNLAYALGKGGVGYYGRHAFVHVDTGPARTWGWRPPLSSRTAAAVK